MLKKVYHTLGYARDLSAGDVFRISGQPGEFEAVDVENASITCKHCGNGSISKIIVRVPGGQISLDPQQWIQVLETKSRHEHVLEALVEGP